MVCHGLLTERWRYWVFMHWSVLVCWLKDREIRDYHIWSAMVCWLKDEDIESSCIGLLWSADWKMKILSLYALVCCGLLIERWRYWVFMHWSVVVCWLKDREIRDFNIWSAMVCWLKDNRSKWLVCCGLLENFFWKTIFWVLVKNWSSEGLVCCFTLALFCPAFL